MARRPIGSIFSTRKASPDADAGAAAGRLEPLRRWLRGILGTNRIPGASSMPLDPTLLGAAILINILGLALPLSVLQIYDRIAPHGATETLTVLGFSLIAVAFIEFALRSGQGFLASLSAVRYGQTLQTMALERLLWAPSSATARRPHAELLDQFNAVDRLTDYYGGQARLAVVDLPFAGVYLVTIAIIGGPLVFVPVVVFSLFLVGVVQIGGRVKAVTHRRDQEDRKVSDFVSEMLSGVATVKSFALEPLMLRRYERLLKTSATLQQESIDIAGDTQRISAVFGAISLLSTLAVGTLLVIHSGLTIGGLAACSLLSSRAIQPILRAAKTWGDLQRAALATNEVSRLFTLPAAPKQFEGERRERPSAIECRSLSLTVDGRALLDAVDLIIEPGRLSAVVGPDGSGKSSFLRLVAGLIEPERGEVLIDGAPAAELRRTMESQICHVGVSATPFAGTILQNLTLFGRGASPSDARWAAELLGLDHSIHKLQSGYETIVGGGVSDTLPAGLLRTISLARAIAQRPRLLLLDEPHVFLDSDGEARLLEALEALRSEATILFATTRAEHVRRADQVLALIDGDVRVSMAGLGPTRGAVAAGGVA